MAPTLLTVEAIKHQWQVNLPQHHKLHRSNEALVKSGHAKTKRLKYQSVCRQPFARAIWWSVESTSLIFTHVGALQTAPESSPLYPLIMWEEFQKSHRFLIVNCSKILGVNYILALNWNPTYNSCKPSRCSSGASGMCFNKNGNVAKIQCIFSGDDWLFCFRFRTLPQWRTCQRWSRMIIRCTRHRAEKKFFST